MCERCVNILYVLRDKMSALQRQTFSKLLPQEPDIPQDLQSAKPVNKFPTFYAIPKIKYMFTMVSHLSLALSHKNTVHVIPYFFKPHFNNILPLYLVLPSGLFSSGFHTKPRINFLSRAYVPQVPPSSFFLLYN